MSVTAYVSPGCKMHCGNLGSLTKLGNICKQRPGSDGLSERVQISFLCMPVIKTHQQVVGG